MAMPSCTENRNQEGEGYPDAPNMSLEFPKFSTIVAKKMVYNCACRPRGSTRGLLAAISGAVIVFFGKCLY